MFPPILLVVVISIVITAALHLENEGLAILGKFPTTLPVPYPPKFHSLELVSDLIQPAVIISIVGFVESMAVSKQCATKHNYNVRPNRELVALGVCNLVGSFIGGWPIFGSITRTLVSDKAGARSQLSGAITGITIIITIVALLPLFVHLPKVVMAGIVVTAAINLVQIEDIIFYIKVRSYVDLFLIAFSCVITFLYGAEVGLLLSIGASLFLVIKHTTMPKFSLLGKMPESDRYKDISMFPEAELVPGMLVIRIEESLYFANMGQIKELIYRIETVGNATSHPAEGLSVAPPPLAAIIIDTRNIPSIDASSMQVFIEMMKLYQNRGIKICLVKLQDSLKRSLLRAGLIEVLGANSLYSSISEAVGAVQSGDKVERSTYRY